ASFDEVFRSESIKVIYTPIRAPQANAYAERFVRTVRAECLDWLLILGRRHLEYVLRTYAAHYNAERPHRALALVPPEPGNTATRPANTRSNATICLADSSTNTDRQRERVLKPLRLSRPAQLPPPCLEASPARRRDRADPAAVRPAPHVRNLRAARWHLHLRPLPLHGREPGDDRPPLRPPRPRRARARGCTP